MTPRRGRPGKKKARSRRPRLQGAPRARRRSSRPSTAADYEVLSPQDRHHYRAAIEALRRMREGATALAAAREEGLSLAQLRRYVGPALRSDRRGRLRAQPTDHFLRMVAFYTPRGRIWLPTRNSEDASRIAQHANAMKAMANGDPRPLRRFAGQRVRVDGVVYPFLTDPVLATMLAKAQLVEYELYKS